MMSKQIYNQDSSEDYMSARTIGGNPNGICNFERTSHKWAFSLFKIMQSYNWFPSEVDISQDKVNYLKLTEAEKRSYDLILAQLISNDSIQTNQLMDSINRYITSPIINACVARQAYEEANHALSYSVMAEDICGDTDRIFNMHKHDSELHLKNKAVESMYGSIYSGNNPSDQDLLMAFAANQILEEQVFPGGFAGMYAMGGKMVGSGKMIAFIHRDEEGSHVPLFKNLFRSTVSENPGILTKDSINSILKMVITMCNAEQRWTIYATKGVLGFSEEAIRLLCEYQANSVATNLKLPMPYAVTKGGPLVALLHKYSMLKSDTKTNFFESKPADYSMGSLDMGDL